MIQPPHCIDCVHHEIEAQAHTDMHNCRRPVRDIVTGEMGRFLNDAYHERNVGACGPAGLAFEAKQS